MKNFTKPLSLLVTLTLISTTSFGQISFTTDSDLLNAAGSNSADPCVVDMNADYLDDVVRITGGVMRIDYQQPDGSFTQQTHTNVQSSGIWSIAAGDVHNDGYNDILIGDGNSVEFVYANGDGTSYTADLQPDYIFSQRSTFADIDNDGHLDAFVCHDVDPVSYTHLTLPTMRTV